MRNAHFTWVGVNGENDLTKLCGGGGGDEGCNTMENCWLNLSMRRYHKKIG